MAYSSTDCEAPTYGGAREYGRRPRGYRALGSNQLAGLGGDGSVTIRGTLQYFSGQETTKRVLLQSGPCATCESYLTRYPNAGWVCKEYATVDGDRWCRFYQDRVTRDLRPGVMGAEGDSGWALYVKDLIPTSGGTLPGWARLQGNLPAGAEHGDTVTLTGQWIGTPPNNLCANCGWDFLVESEAAAGTPTTPGGGAITQDSPEIVKARIEASGVQAERDAIAAGATAEEAAQVRAETEAELANGADGTDGLPPVTRAGIGSGALAALIVGGIVLLPILGKGRKRNGGAPGGIASW